MQPGSTLGPYEILSSLGAGGMGEVYLARDPRLERRVAIKVLPEAFVADPDRLARFEREAKVLASLNHPNIGQLYGLEEAEGTKALILELVEGPTLADRIAQGPIPLEESLAIARQIADGLEAAHEQGVVHRDLKPANVKVKTDGTVKVLDFGLAKALEPEPSSADMADSPTITRTAAATGAGIILGTAAYMSPEQAKGGAVDKRADIWAFGVVLYEMLTGKRLIEGESMPEMLGSLFRQEIALGELPPATPPAVRRLLTRCLTRDPKRRLRDIGDARLELEAAGTQLGSPGIEAAGPLATIPTARRWLPLLTFVAGALLFGLASWWSLRGTAPAPQPLTRFALRDIGVPVDAFFGLAVSPDGRKLVYRARDEGDDDAERLYVRSFDSLEASPLPGTDLGWLPFFSPDGERVAFMGDHGLMVVGLSGGSARSIADVGGGFAGGTWLPDDSIVFAPAAGRRLYRVPASGGSVELLEIQPSEEGDLVTSPSALPDGRAVLCSWGGGSNFDVALYDLDSGRIEVLVENGFTPTWVETGHILYQEGVNGPLMALPFDADSRVVTGNAFPVVEDLGTRVSYQVRMFAVGGTTLAYVPSSSYLDSGGLVWVDRQGETTPIVDLEAVIDMPRLSGDGRRVAFRAAAPQCNVWVHDLERGATTRVTFEGDNHGTVWSPDDRRILLARNETPEWGILSVSADGAGSAERLAPPEIPRAMTSSVSPDGRYVLVSSQREETGADIDLVDASDRSVTPLLRSRFREEAGALSPDGRLLAYTSNESGRQEVYLQTFPALDHRQQVSTRGGTEPVWSASGEELFFRVGRKIMVVSVEGPAEGTGTAEGSLRVSPPALLFEGPPTPGSGGNLPSYDVSADGQRFVMIRPRSGASGAEIHVVTGWLDELRRLAGD